MVAAKLHDRWDVYMDWTGVQAKIKCKKELFLIHVGYTYPINFDVDKMNTRKETIKHCWKELRVIQLITLNDYISCPYMPHIMYSRENKLS